MEIKTSSINLIATAMFGGKETLQISLKETYRQRPQYQQYLRKEFARGKDLDCPSIFKYLDFKETADGGPTISLEWEDSNALADWLKDDHNDDEKKRVVRQVVDALEYMHNSGVVHGNLNKRNIFITKKGTVKLLTVRERYTDLLSQPTDNLKYMAPEAKDGTVALDARTDVYALGVLLKDLGFMEEYRTVIAKCVSFGRNERFEDIEAFTDAFEKRRYVRTTDRSSAVSSRPSSNKTMAVLAAVAAIVIIVGVAVFMNRNNDDENLSAMPAQTETVADGQQTTVATDSVPQQTTPSSDMVEYGEGNEYLTELVPQMKTDLDKIYNAGDDAATTHKKVARYYKGLRRVLKKQGKTEAQLDAFDKAFAQYTSSH